MRILPAMVTLLAVLPAHAGTTMRYTVLSPGQVRWASPRSIETRPTLLERSPMIRRGSPST